MPSISLYLLVLATLLMAGRFFGSPWFSPMACAGLLAGSLVLPRLFLKLRSITLQAEGKTSPSFSTTRSLFEDRITWVLGLAALLAGLGVGSAPNVLADWSRHPSAQIIFDLVLTLPVFTLASHDFLNWKRLIEKNTPRKRQRPTWFRFCLVPFLCFLAIHWSLQSSVPFLVHVWNDWSVIERLLLGFGGALAILELPLCLWKMGKPLYPLPLNYERTIQTPLRKWGFSNRKTFRFWTTPGLEINAVALPRIWGHSEIVLSEGFLNLFSKREIELWVRHEIGHLELHHHTFRLGALALPFSLLFLLYLQGWIDLSSLSFSQHSVVGIQNLAAILVTTMIAAFLFRKVAWASELEADRFAIRMRKHLTYLDPRDARDLKAALEKLTSLNPEHASIATWTHPSLMSRIQQLEHLLANQKSRANIESWVTAPN